MTETSHIDHSQKAKNLPMSQLSLQLSEHLCHSRDIHTIYAELLTPGGLLYVPSLSVVINLSFSASIGLPFIWCRRRCLGERFARELNRKKTKSRDREKTNQTKVITFLFAIFLLIPLKVELLCPFLPSHPCLSPVSLPFPSFSCQSHQLASNVSPQASPDNTLIGSSPNCPIPPSNSLQCRLPSTFIFQSCPCSSPLPVPLQTSQTNVWHICSSRTDHTADKALRLACWV